MVTHAPRGSRSLGELSGSQTRRTDTPFRCLRRPDFEPIAGAACRTWFIDHRTLQGTSIEPDEPTPGPHQSSPNPKPRLIQHDPLPARNGAGPHTICSRSRHALVPRPLPNQPPGKLPSPADWSSSSPTSSHPRVRGRADLTGVRRTAGGRPVQLMAKKARPRAERTPSSGREPKDIDG